jgi:hypothetical protein
MAVRITASVTVRKRDLRAEGLSVDNDTAGQYVARRVADILRQTVSRLAKSTAFVDGIVVTVQEVDKQGQPKGIAYEEPSRTQSDTGDHSLWD